MGHVLQRVGGDAGIKRLPRRTRSGGASGAAVRVRSITHTPAEERAKRLAVQVRGEVGEAFAQGHAAALSGRYVAMNRRTLASVSGHSLRGLSRPSPRRSGMKFLSFNARTPN